MDPELGRCRRTDGKKWRCRLPVLPDKKYCERHIHRGRLSSGKPVEEVTKAFSMPNSTTKSSIPSVKTTINPRSTTLDNARNNNKVCTENQSFEMKKRTRESAPEFSFFPKSVVQHGNVQGCGTEIKDHNSVLAETESERCRTDSKKWRCRKDDFRSSRKDDGTEQESEATTDSN